MKGAGRNNILFCTTTKATFVAIVTRIFNFYPFSCFYLFVRFFIILILNFNVVSVVMFGALTFGFVLDWNLIK